MKSHYLSIISALLSFTGCASSHRSTSGEDNPLVEGTIEYPFAEETVRIGKNQNREPFSVKSGQGQYQVDLPGAADDYDVNFPLDAMPSSHARETPGSKPNVTDREFEANMPKLPEPDDRHLIEGALGLGENGGPGQAPSYTLTVNKINGLFKERKFELALVEINQLLGFYPTDPRLYKMKGTVLIKTRNFKMAELAWTRASEFAPQDSTLKTALTKLRERNLAEAASP